MTADLLASLDLARALVRSALRALARAPGVAVRVVRLELQTYQLRRVVRLVLEEHKATRLRERRRARSIRLARPHSASRIPSPTEATPPIGRGSLAPFEGARGETRP